MKKKWKDIFCWQNIFLTIFFGGMFGYGFYLIIYEGIIRPELGSYLTKKEAHYTISLPVNESDFYRGSSKVGYNHILTVRYIVNNKTYSIESYKQLKNFAFNGSRFYIAFYPSLPTFSKAVPVIATEEEYKKMPPEGYKELPERVSVLVNQQTNE